MPFELNAETLNIILVVALGVSEALAKTDKFKSNSMLDIITNILKSFKKDGK